MKLEIFNEYDIKLPKPKIKKLFKTVMDDLMDTQARGWINIIITDDENIKKLNNKFRKINKATDVLSFNMEAPKSDDAVFGELYISYETTKRQAERNKNNFESEILLLICHGLLHLLGYDHQKIKDYNIMKELEDYYLAKM